MCLDRLGVDNALADAFDVVVVEAVEIHRAASELGAEDQQVDVSHQSLSLVRVVPGGALDGRHAADRGTDLRVAGHRGLYRHRFPTRGQHMPGLLDEPVVLVAVTPPAAVDVDVRWLPRREHVVLRMPMQIDQTRHDHTPGADRVLDIARLGRAHRHDLPALHHHPATSSRSIALQDRPTNSRRLRRNSLSRRKRSRQGSASIQWDIPRPRRC